MATRNAPKLSTRDSLLVGSLLFGLFFGAGNLIFPMSLGLQAGSSALLAAIGFLITAVGLPILGVIGSAVAGASDLHDFASRIHPWFATIFTCALYLTIGPFFAIPRTATVSFEMAFGSLDGTTERWALLGFSVVFFAVVLTAAWRPGKLLDYVGKFLTPVFLILLGILLVATLIGGSATAPEAIGPYSERAVVQGIFDGYNTMDALASLAFAIIIIDAVRRLGVTSPRGIAAEVTRSGFFAAMAMGVIYVALALAGAQSVGIVERDANGAVALAALSTDRFGAVGHTLAAAIMLVACLKTAIGLIVACSEMFETMFPRLMKQRSWAISFVLVSLVMANFGLETIIKAAVPVLQVLYPMAIVMIVLGLLHRWVRDKHAARWLPMLLAGIVSVVSVAFGTDAPIMNLLPGYAAGFGWILPASVGLVLGLLTSDRRITQ